MDGPDDLWPAQRHPQNRRIDSYCVENPTHSFLTLTSVCAEAFSEYTDSVPATDCWTLRHQGEVSQWPDFCFCVASAVHRLRVGPARDATDIGKSYNLIMLKRLILPVAVLALASTSAGPFLLTSSGAEANAHQVRNAGQAPRQQVSEPETLAILGTGLFVLGALVRRRMNRVRENA